MPPDPTPETKSTALHSLLNQSSQLCKIQSLYQTLFCVELATILLFQWNHFLNYTHLSRILPNAEGSILPSHLTDIYQWLAITQKIKSRSLRMALRVLPLYHNLCSWLLYLTAFQEAWIESSSASTSYEALG